MNEPLRSFVPALLRLSILLAACAAEAAGQTITDLGALPGGGGNGVKPSAVNADGSIVVGTGFNGVAGHAFRWTTATGAQDLGAAPGAVESGAHGLSGDGSLVVGDEGGDMHGGGAFTWTSSGGMQSFSLSGWNPVYLYGVSSDGGTLIGTGGDQSGDWSAFTWTLAGGMQLLDPADLYWDDTPSAVNDDGSVIVGGAYYGKGFRWTSAGGMQDIGDLPGQHLSGAVDLNADGSIAVGSSGTFTASAGWVFLHACRWISSGGIEDLGVLPGDDHSYATGVSGDGSIVVGTSYHNESDGLHARPFLWTPLLGILDLSDHLAKQGLDLTGWILGDITGISADGSALVGRGVLNDHAAAWIINGLQDASWSNYGSGFAGTYGVPSFTSQSAPALGTTLTLDVGNSSGLSTAGLLFVGSQQTAIHSKWGGDLLVVPLLTLEIGLPPGGTSISGSLPIDQSLWGVAIDLQVFEVDAGAAHGVSFTPGLQLLLGN